MLLNTKAIVVSSFTKWDLRYVSHAFSGKTTLEYDNEDLIESIMCANKYWTHYLLTQGFVNDGSLLRLCINECDVRMLKYLIGLGLYVDRRLGIYAAESNQDIEMIDILSNVVGKTSEVIFYALKYNNEPMLKYCFEKEYPIDEHLINAVNATLYQAEILKLSVEIKRREKIGLYKLPKCKLSDL
jgi:hypothetical protein